MGKKTVLFGIFKRIFDFLIVLFIAAAVLLLITSAPVRNSVRLSENELFLFGKSCRLDGVFISGLRSLISFNEFVFGKIGLSLVRFFGKALITPLYEVLSFLAAAAIRFSGGL